MLRSIGLAAAACALCACALVRTKYWHSYADESKPGVALVYGYLDMSEAPAPLQRLRARRLGARSEEGDVYFGTRGGLFYNEDLPAGDYKLAAVEGKPALFYLGPLAVWPGQTYAAALPPRVGLFHVKGPGVYYVGSFRYKRISAFVDDFTVERVAAPSERELLPQLSRVLVESRWEKPVAARLAAAKPALR